MTVVSASAGAPVRALVAPTSVLWESHIAYFYGRVPKAQPGRSRHPLYCHIGDQWVVYHSQPRTCRQRARAGPLIQAGLMSHLALKGATPRGVQRKGNLCHCTQPHPASLSLQAALPQGLAALSLYTMHRGASAYISLLEHNMQRCLKLDCPEISLFACRYLFIKRCETWRHLCKLCLSRQPGLTSSASPVWPSPVWLPAGPDAQTSLLLPTGNFTGSLHSTHLLFSAGTLAQNSLSQCPLQAASTEG